MKECAEDIALLYMNSDMSPKDMVEHLLIHNDNDTCLKNVQEIKQYFHSQRSRAFWVEVSCLLERVPQSVTS